MTLVFLHVHEERGQPLAEVQSVEPVLSSFWYNLSVFSSSICCSIFCIICEPLKLFQPKCLYKYPFSAVKSVMLIFRWQNLYSEDFWNIPTHLNACLHYFVMYWWQNIHVSTLLSLYHIVWLGLHRIWLSDLARARFSQIWNCKSGWSLDLGQVLLSSIRHK